MFNQNGSLDFHYIKSYFSVLTKTSKLQKENSFTTAGFISENGKDIGLETSSSFASRCCKLELSLQWQCLILLQLLLDYFQKYEPVSGGTPKLVWADREVKYCNYLWHDLCQTETGKNYAMLITRKQCL